ncbi:ExbD/TolR family protein [Sedimentitalea arenosa]|uniref:Biopolymer transporter ExbD n=1 Tax=Sedimentitalea arenosa TaxID=2798803 RepID=A0A8J7ITI5_9RHOB|nr:biopolymer transporter ExbD [Arenibacterium arenosum]MBJ6372526.1 biopolymer transporter ExbD [Arenibacterium arenosum]
MTSGLALRKPRKPGPLISLVPMIDVMLILLVFFMVTSTYLNLDMIPALKRQEETSTSAPEAKPTETLLIRLGANGLPIVRGRSVPLEDLSGYLVARLAEAPRLQVLVLPSGGASTQALISVMDHAARAGIGRLRVIRLDAKP